MFHHIPRAFATDLSKRTKPGALPQTPPKAMPLETIYFQMIGVQGRCPCGVRGGAPFLLRKSQPSGLLVLDRSEPQTEASIRAIRSAGSAPASAAATHAAS